MPVRVKGFKGDDPGLIFPSPIGVGAVVTKHTLERLLRLFKKGESKEFHQGSFRKTSKSVNRRFPPMLSDRRQDVVDRRSMLRRLRDDPTLAGKSVRREADLPERLTRGRLSRDRRQSQDSLAVNNIGFTEKTISADIMRFLRKGQEMDLNIAVAEKAIRNSRNAIKEVRELGKKARNRLKEPADFSPEFEAIADKFAAVEEVRKITKNIFRTAAQKFRKKK